MRLRWTFAVLSGLVFLTALAGAQVATRPAGDVAGAPVPTGVRNAPFSAVVITQYDRVLDNGGHIHRETLGKIFRDSQGRARTESEMAGAQPGADKYEHITINDPVQQLIINLNSKSRTATVYHFGQGVGASALGAVMAKGQTSTPADRSSAAPAATIQIGATPPSQIGSGAINSAPDPRRSKSVTTTKKGATINATPVDTRTVPLGTRNIEGVLAIGTRTTRTIDADLMGTDKPVVSVTDTWFSPELNATILTETDDGQSGHTTMKLVSIVRIEPDPQLFRVPSDYAVRESVPAAPANRH